MDPVRAAMETFVRLTAYNTPLPRISSQGIGITCIVTKFQFFSELESLFCTFLICNRKKTLLLNLLTTTVYFKQTSMNATEPFIIATIPMKRALTPWARLVVHVNLGLREME